MEFKHSTILLREIKNKIKAIPIPFTNIDDKVGWESTTSGELSIKMASMANNDQVPLTQRLIVKCYLAIETFPLS